MSIHRNRFCYVCGGDFKGEPPLSVEPAIPIVCRKCLADPEVGPRIRKTYEEIARITNRPDLAAGAEKGA